MYQEHIELIPRVIKWDNIKKSTTNCSVIGKKYL